MLNGSILKEQTEASALWHCWFYSCCPVTTVAERFGSKIMTLSAMEFIRRFLLHILPKGFMKIRHYGLLGNRNKTKKLILCKRLTNTPIRLKEKLPAPQLLQKLIGHDITTCPVCGTLLQHASLPPPLVS